MSLEDLRKRLEDLRRKRAGQPQSLESLLCDNFAGALRGKAILYAQTKKESWAFGECESDKYGGHRFNIVTVKGKHTLFIEPQEDRFFTKTGKFKFIVL
jgi:hypothetical protein